MKALSVSHLVGMALQNTLPWTSLAILLNDLSPTLIEAREVINILLKELETLQLSFEKKEKELELFQKGNPMTSVESDLSNGQEMNNSSETELILENRNELDASLPETETSENEIEVLDVVKENFNNEMSFDLNESRHSEVDVKNKECVSRNRFADNVEEIENEWYTFVSDDKLMIQKMKNQIKESKLVFK